MRLLSELSIFFGCVFILMGCVFPLSFLPGIVLLVLGILFRIAYNTSPQAKADWEAEVAKYRKEAK